MHPLRGVLIFLGGKMKKRAFSGIQPSGELTIGNYLGALKNFSKLSEEYEGLYCVVDQHAITVKQEPKLLRESTLKNLSLYLASGLDPEKDTLFIQSHVPEHAELAWVLGCNSYMGELSRMTQYKDKSQKHGESIPVGLFYYPILMASDILLYQTDIVPIGDDQKQHLELARDIAIRFNNAYSPTFKVPEGYFNKIGAKIYDLQNPTKKMSKSEENINGIIFLLDDEKTIRRKISRAVTDSVGVVNYCDEQPGVKNLLNIYALMKDVPLDESLKAFKGMNYKDLKEGVADSVIDVLVPLQERFYEFYNDKDRLEAIYTEGAKRARYMANKTLSKVYRKVGFIKR